MESSQRLPRASASQVSGCKPNLLTSTLLQVSPFQSRILLGLRKGCCEFIPRPLLLNLPMKINPGVNAKFGKNILFFYQKVGRP